MLAVSGGWWRGKSVMKTRLAALILCIIILAPLVARAAIFDHTKKWMTLTTPHFFIRYAQENEALAKKAAVICEQAYRDLVPKFNWKPWGRTEVVLVDSTDLANGMASVIPYNWILLYAAAPIPDKSLGYYDDWLRYLIYHEVVHILHLDAARGWWKAFRVIFGKTVAPAGMVPTWVKEGEAVYIESEYTKAGRGRSSFTEMLLRTSILEDTFPSISQGDGLQWSWPTYNIPYLFGGEFIEWLVDTYGFEKLIAFNDRTQRTLLLSMVNYAARTVYGKTFVQLWKEWQEDLQKRYAEVKRTLDQRGITATKAWTQVNPSWEEYIEAPALSPDGRYIAYAVSSPHHADEIRMLDLETGKVHRLKKKQGANQISWHPQSESIVYASIGSYKTYNYYFDLWEYSFETGKATQLTKGERARDPDYAPDGKSVVYVASRPDATDVLKIYDVETKESRVLTPNVPMGSRFANPRFSRDGRWIAVTAWDPKNLWKIYRYSADGRSRMKLTKERHGMELRPWWTPDGRYVLYSSDVSGIDNIYRVAVTTGRSEQLTNVYSGAFQPSTADGRTIAIQYYTSQGFELHTFEARPVYPPIGGKISGGRHVQEGWGELADYKVDERTGPGAMASREPIELELTPKKYSPFGKSLFLPRFIVPAVTYTQDEIFAAFTTGGADVLRWHNWLGGLTYITGANYLGYFARYFYNRWRPIMGFGIVDYVVDYGNLTFALDPGDPNLPPILDTRRYWEKRRNVYGFLTIPVKRHAFGVSYSFEDRMAHSSLLDVERAALTLGHFAGFTFVYGYNDTENYRAAISPENGRQIQLKTTWTDRAFGSGVNNEQIIFVGDWREFVRLYHHHVLAFRIQGGMNWGDRLTQGTFVVGGALGEGTLARQSSLNYFALRGLPLSAFGATRALVMSMEYRIPIVSPQRGLGTWPLYLQNLHCALFADYGDGWVADQKPDDIRDFFDDFLLGVGLELRGDFVIGHGLAVKGRLGYGIIVLNRDRLLGLSDRILGTDAKYGVLILELGTSF